MKVLIFSLLISTQAFPIGNPAAIFCEDVANGESVTTTDKADNSGSQSGVCVLNNTTVISDWSLFVASKIDHRGDDKEQRATQATKALLADKTCKEAKGTVKKVFEYYGDKRVFQMCRFKDGSEISVKALDAGPVDASNKALVSLLK